MMTCKEIIEQELKKGDGCSIINIVDQLVIHAYNTGASDIHIVPTEQDVHIRLRIDGVLERELVVPRTIRDSIVSRIKVLASLRTDEHQAAQDGRFRMILPQNATVDVRVSIAPTYHGENVVMRLLVDKAMEFSLEMLGFSEDDKAKVEAALQNTTGMILATGPTGSGKTTTLYTLVKMLNKEEISILTIEDPIEYAVNGIEQIQVNPHSGLTFANGLRSILRQDPDIIMVGEIRDAETANIAINTALTGHLLLSTIHTNDAATTLPRLLDMKIEPYLVASTVTIAIGQRLVRRICHSCKKEVGLSKTEQEHVMKILPQTIADQSMTTYRGEGCDKCNGTGYRGRVCINEVMVMNDSIRDAILRKASASEIKRIAIRTGMTSMLQDGMYKVRDGITTLEEVLRVIRE
ncbi:MAG: GspE/PulE family protein [Patescibacteria group bacterium]